MLKIIIPFFALTFSTLALAHIPYKPTTSLADNTAHFVENSRTSLLAANFTRKAAVPRRDYSDDYDYYNRNHREQRVPFSSSGSRFGGSGGPSSSSFFDSKPLPKSKSYNHELKHEEWWLGSQKPSLLW